MKKKTIMSTIGITYLLVLMWVLQITIFAQDDSVDVISSFAEEATVAEVDCTLSNGEESTCYQIDSISIPVFEIGPFCPETLDDVGGIWEWDGDNPGLYALDSEFFLMVEEQGFVFFDEDGNINIVTQVGGGAPTDNDAPADNAQNASNNCLAQTPDETITMTALIPATPVLADTPTDLGVVAQVGIGIDGVPIFADAPSAVETGNLPALDTCGGHVDPGGWYHWHATASDIDTVFEEEEVDAHCHLDQSASSLFGYAFDGYAIYGSAEPDGHVAEDLDECNGHFGPTPENPDGEEYHYHARLDFPNLPTCLVGVVANNSFSTTASSGIGANQGGGPGQGNGGQDGQGQNQPDFAAAAEQLGITEATLQEALGDERPPNFEVAAETLGITLEELQDALGIGQ
ncbi:MAG: hypothetical protein Phog2KO_11690 [Phototrophicaceae bacterium]